MSNDPEVTPAEAGPLHTVSVRRLVEFVLQAGDITPGGFQRRDRAQLGTLGHQRVQRSRPADYAPEVEIVYRVDGAEPPVEIRGRIDGLYPDRVPVILEEIKTTTWSLEQVTERHNPLHWAQAQVYAYLYARQQNLEQITVQLTYYQLDTRDTKTFEHTFERAELQAFFEAVLTPYLAWTRQRQAWQQQRDRSIDQLEFPYADYRPGQRDMAVAVYKAIRSADRLYVQSPTGVGKTIAALFPAIKALGQGLVTKIFYLTAKTSGARVAEKALADLRQAGLQLTSVTLTAKEKICFCPPVNCDPEVCVYARDYFGKVKGALAELNQTPVLTRAAIETLARRHEVCPFELSLDLALWADCLIADYNYVFDPRVYLHRFFDVTEDPYVFLIDEAHNLPDRARAMYSAELDKKSVLALQQQLKPHLPQLAKKLRAINRILLEHRKACQAANRPALIEHEPPGPLLKAVREFCQQAEAWLIQNQPAEFRPDLLDFYFQCSNYLRTAEAFDTYYVSYFEQQGAGDLKAKLFCLDPAPLLAERLDRSRAAVFFSATLLPLDYFMKLLTGTAVHPRRIFPSPFPREHVCLVIHRGIATRYAQRAESYAAVAAAVAVVCRAQVGNYLVFFPSYAYLTAVLGHLQADFPASQLLVQDRGMSETARDDFLAQFSAEPRGTLIGLAVMGGIFGEGIDLVGDRLIGAVVVGVGVPQLGLERDLIKDYFDQDAGRGYAYAYQYPGFNRVLQATGRVIRTETDRGVIVLIDDRFAQARYRELFPAHWHGAQSVPTTEALAGLVARFWTPPTGD